MAYTKIALFAAIAALASAQTQDQINELNVILNDVKSHLQDYMSLAQDPSSGFSLSSMPAGVLDIGMALASATDDSYTTLYSKVDFAGVSKMLTMVPWYSSRLEPALKSLDGDATSTAAPSSSAAPTSSAAPSSSEAKSSSAAPSSSEAKSSSAAPSSSEAKSSSAAPSSSEAKSSSAAPSSTEAKTTSAAPSSTGAKTSAISQITDGQIQATKAVSEQTENGAAKAFVGMGAGVVAAAAMLL
ncbi:CGH_1_HP_G0056590.mRNA.1.CDS.1 [Saccharomyces cerevisiae]|nr:CGH_1_HP_G0056590.mRNA.1.CDS.1 [Saccharomyces cerevisiae]CAI6796825.1 CGH_1_HP_G0056590.mRNA.1.CDS.1 [Saccharomyces cerevisiae]